MSLKLHIFHSHIGEFNDNLGDYSEEQGERFHQDVKSFEERYKGQCNENMMGDYICNLLRESDLTYNRQSRKKISFGVVLLTKLSCMALRSSNQAAIFHHVAYTQESPIKCLSEGPKKTCWVVFYNSSCVKGGKLLEGFGLTRLTTESESTT